VEEIIAVDDRESVAQWVVVSVSFRTSFFALYKDTIFYAVFATTTIVGD